LYSMLNIKHHSVILKAIIVLIAYEVIDMI
jgi:hypothetical protein